jgi:polysaccharide export outer membrane protein
MSAVPVSLSTLLRCACVAALLALGACGDSDSTPIVPDTSVSSGKMSLTGGNGGGGDRAGSDYRLGPNDRTRIIVYGQPNLTGEFVLDGNGNLAVGGRCGAHRVELLESVPMAEGGVVV